MNRINFILNPNARDNSYKKTPIKFISHDIVKQVKNFHKSFPSYKITPLYNLNNLAKKLGVNRLWVKDESFRFGLNAFKVLGALYAIAKYLNKEFRERVSISYGFLKKLIKYEKDCTLTFVTATDGNHGRAVAWSARQLSQKSVIFMPKGSSISRIKNIKNEAAKVIVTDVNYDETVKIANNYADEHDFILIQDTAWKGYEEIPIWIMQGYTTLIDEVLEQLAVQNEENPTHVFLQVGVGSFAGAIQGYFFSLFGKARPIIATLEPDSCASILKSVEVGDGLPHSIDGAFKTIMVGLACGTPNPIAWRILRDYTDIFFSCPDYIAINGMRILANPLHDDPKVISGESGAIGLGLVASIFQNEIYKEIINKLEINGDSRLLVISTEGNTDPENYRKLVYGENSSTKL